jgi:RNA-dependent RNA polymerase
MMLTPPSTSHIFAKWTSWDSLSVSLHGVPPNLNTFTVWKSLTQYGTIDYIELFEDSKGQRDGKGRVRFK